MNEFFKNLKCLLRMCEMETVWDGKGVYQKGKREQVQVERVLVKRCRRCLREIEIWANK